MGAPKNNSFWKLRTNKTGADKIFADPDILFEEAMKYFDSVDNNPLYRYEAIKSGEKAGELIQIPISRPYTMKGLCIYLGVTEGYFNETLRSYEGKNDDYCKRYVDIITRIREIIYTNKFEGGAANQFNAMIISRDLGLMEQTDNKHEVKVAGVKIVIDGDDYSLEK